MHFCIPLCSSTMYSSLQCLDKARENTCGHMEPHDYKGKHNLIDLFVFDRGFWKLM